MRISRDAWGIELAKVTAKRGTCCRRQVGCVLIDAAGHVLATGYNGVATGQKHCNESRLVEINSGAGPYWETEYPNACAGAKAASGTNLDACQAIHAEQNALLQCRDVAAIHTCFVTCSPCVTCTKLLLNTGCRRIVFAEAYPAPETQVLWTGVAMGSHSINASGRTWELVK